MPYNEDGQKLLLPQTTDMSRKDNLKLLYNSSPEGMCDNEYESLEQSINDVETFQYSHETSTKHVLVQGVYVGSASPLIADIKTQPYSVLTYMDDGMMTGTYDNTHDIPIYVDNGSTLNIMPTHFYDKAYYLHHLPKALTAAETIHTGNGPVKTHFWIDILLNVQGCMIQFKLLVCDTQAQTGILLSKMALEQLQTWQDYSTNTLYVKQTAIPLHAIQNIELLPDRKTTIEVIADRTNELQYKELIDGQGIVWVWSNDSSKPLQLIVATFHNDKTLITFENTTGQTQYISKGAKVTVLDMHSKYGGMTNFEWDIPTDDEGNLVLYAHTFACSLKPTKLANEDPVLQAETKITVSQTPNEHTVERDNTEDPYPWLDADDPRRKMTDEEILHLKVPFDKSILTAAEKERLIKLMLENTVAFSIRDEIGTCPYFEVKLKLRDDKPFFVRPYNTREDQKPIIQKEMDRLEKLRIIRKGLTGYKKPSTKAAHIATKILITGSGHMATLITVTLMGNLFYQCTNVEMLEETYFKFKKNILPKMKKMQPNFQEPVVEYYEPDQVIDICSYNHYPVLDKTNETQEQHNDDNDIYDTSEHEHEFEYRIYEDVFKTEQLMAELKRIDEAKQEKNKLRDLEFKGFPLEQFSDAGREANEGYPYLKQQPIQSCMI